MGLYYKYVEEYLQYSLISIAGKSKLNCIVNIPQHLFII
jgi:hypothetical protein